MPSGPKKRRAARRKRAGTGPNGDHEEEEFDAAGDMKLEAVDKTGSKESQSLDQIALKSPPLQDVPVVEECDSVVGNGKSESEHESVHDKIITHAPVMESAITIMESSDSVGNKEKESESEPVDQVLIQPSSKETKENENSEINMHAQVMESAITMVESSDSVGNKEKESESEHVDQVLIQPCSKETKGNENTEVGEGSFHGAMEMVDRGFPVVKEGEETTKEDVLQDPIEEPNVGSSHQPQAIVDTVDQLVPKALPLQEAVQDLTVPTESVSEVNVETFIEDSVKETPGSSSLDNVSADHEGVVQETEGVEVGEVMLKDVVSGMNEGEEMSLEGVGEDPFEEPTRSSSHEPQPMVKIDDKLVLMPIRIKEAQDPSVPVESDIEVDADSISFEDAPDSFETPLGSPSMGYISQVIPLNEARVPYLATELVDEVNVQTSLKEDQDSFTELQGVSSLVDVSPVEGVLQVNEVAKVGESACDDEPVLKVNEEISMQSVPEEPLEELLDSSLHEVVIKTDDELVMERIPLEEAQNLSVVVESVIEEDVETYSKDAKDSFREPVESLSPTDASPMEEVIQGNVCAVGECACDRALINHVVSKGEKMSVEGVREDSFASPTGKSLHELQVMVDTVYQSVLKVISLKETQTPFVSPLSVIEVNEETPFKDAQDYYKELLGSPSLEDLSPVESFVQFDGHGNKSIGISPHEQQGDVTSFEGVVLGNECAEVGKGAFNHLSVLKEDEEMPIEDVLEDPSDEIQAMTKPLDQEIPRKEDQDPSGDSVSEANVEISLKDAQVYSFKVSPFKEVGESATLVNPFVLGMEEDEEISVDEGVLEEPFEDPIEPSSDELQTIVKLVDNSILEVMPPKDVEDPVVPGESLSEENVETSIKDAQESFKEPMGDSSVDDVSSMDQGQQVMVNHVESVMKENEDMSMEVILEEPISSSSDEPQPMDKRVDQDLSTQAESIIEVNVDASFEVAQDSFKMPMGDTAVDDVSDVQGNKVVEVSDQSASPGQPAMVKSIELVMEDEEMSMKGALEEPFEEPIELSSPKPQTMGNTVNQSVLKEAQVVFVPSESVIDVNVETTFIDGQDSFNDKGHESAVMVNHVELVMGENEEMPIEVVLVEPFEELIGNTSSEQEIIVNAVDQSVLKEAQDPSLQSESGNDVLPIEGVVKGNDIDEVVESACHGSQTMVNHVVSVLKDDDGEMSMEGVLQDPFKDPTEHSLDEPQAVINTIDQLVLKELHFKEVQDPSVIKVNVDTSFEDAQDSFGTPLGSPSVGHVSPVEDFSQWNGDRNESTVNSSHELEVMVKTVDQSVPKAIVLKEAQDTFVSVESIIEENVETPLRDAKHSPMESLGSFSLADVSSMEGIEENECAEVGESALLGPPAMVDHVVSVLKDEKEVSMEGGLQEQFRAEIEPSDEPEVVVKTVDQFVPKETTLKEAQDNSISVESVIEANVETPLRDAKDSLIESLRSFSLTDVSSMEGIEENEYAEFGEIALLGPPAMVDHVVSVLKDEKEVSMEGGLEERFKAEIEPSDEPEVMVKTIDQLFLKVVSLTEVQDPSEPAMSVLEVNVEDAQDSLKESMESPSLNKVTFILANVHLDGYENKPTERSSNETQLEMLKTNDQKIPLEEAQDPLLPRESVIEANVVETSSKGVDVSSKEGDAQVNRGDEVGESACDDVFILKDEENSMECVLEEPLEELTELSSDELQAMMKKVDKVRPSEEVQDPYLPVGSVTEEDVQTALKDAQDSFSEPPGTAFSVDVSPAEGIVEGKDYYVTGGESADMVNHFESTMMSIKGVLEEAFEEPTQAMVKTDDQSVLKGLHVKEDQDPSVADSVIKVNVDTSFENAQDSFETPLGSPSVGHVSPVEGFAEWNEPIGHSSNEPHVMVMTVDQVVSQVIPLDETLESSLPADSVIEANLERSLKDTKDSSIESSGSFVLADVSSMEGVVQGNECAEVGENAFQGPPLMVDHVGQVSKDDKEVSMEGVLEESIKEPIGSFSDELQTVVKTVDLSVQDPSVPGIVQGKEYAEGSENARMVNHVESLKKENEDLSLEGVTREPLEKPVGDSSHEQEAMVDTTDRSLLKKIPLKEAEDPYVPVESFIKVNVETPFKDAQESVPLGSPTLVDVFPVGGIVQGNEFDNVGYNEGHGSPVMANRGSSSLVGGVGQRNGQRNEMVGLVRTLLEEIRRIRAFYEEGLRQTTKIDHQILQVLEKFDSEEIL